MNRIGAHMPDDKLVNMCQMAINLNTNIFQFYPKGKIKDEDIEACKNLMIEKDINCLIHTQFMANGASDKEDIRKKAKGIIESDIKLANALTNTNIVFHPGNHMKQGEDVGIKLVSEMINQILTKEQNAILLLETMAGKGTDIAYKLENLKKIIDQVELKDKIGICLDTCHMWDAGYDLNNIDNVVDSLNNIIGIENIKAIHLNNSLNECGSKKDRHANLDAGKITLECISNIINNEKLKTIPIILETPIDIYTDYEKDLNIIRSLKK
jgi:deoxyribonuclease IV